MTRMVALGAVAPLLMSSALLAQSARAQEVEEKTTGQRIELSESAPLRKFMSDLEETIERFRRVAAEFVRSAQANDIDRMMEMTFRRTIKKRGEEAVRAQYENEIGPTMRRCDTDAEQMVNPIAGPHEQWQILMDCRIAGVSDGLLDLTVINYGKQGLVISGYEYRAGDALPTEDKVGPGGLSFRRTRIPRPAAPPRSKSSFR